jgi:hypothetical protein
MHAKYRRNSNALSYLSFEDIAVKFDELLRTHDVYETTDLYGDIYFRSRDTLKKTKKSSIFNVPCNKN